MTLKRTAFLRKPPEVDRLTVTLIRSRKCKICFPRFTPARKNVTWCGDECGYLVVQQEIAKKERTAERARKEAAKVERAEFNARKEKAKTRGDHIKAAQTAFNAYVRARDAALPCICCGRTSDKQFLTGTNWDCGHYRSRGSAPHLRFHEDNAHRQLVYCNRHGAGRAVDYRLGLIARIGIERVEAVEADQEPRNWTVDQLIAIKTEYQLKLKQLLSKL